MRQLRNIERDRLARLQAATLAQQELDDMVLDMYGITAFSWKEVIKLGTPWTRNQ